MKKFTENLAELVKVKTIVTFILVVVFAVLALRGDISADNVQELVMLVIAFYFGSQATKKSNEAMPHNDPTNGGDVDV